MDKVCIAYVTSNEADVSPLSEAFTAVDSESRGAVLLRVRIGADLATKAAVEDLIAFIRASRLLIIHLHGGERTIPEFDRLTEEARKAGVPLHVQSISMEQNMGLMGTSTVDRDDYVKIARYIEYNGTANFKNLLLFAANRFAGAGFTVDAPRKPAWDGIYHPDFDHAPDLPEYLERKHVDGLLTVGIIFYQTFWQSRNTAFVDSLIREVEAQGANVLPVFFYGVKDTDRGTKGVQRIMEEYFMDGNAPRIDVLVHTVMFSMTQRIPAGEENDASGPDNDGYVRRLKVPVIKAISTMSTLEDWRDTPQGLSPIDVTMSLALPEIDGTIIAVPVSAREYSVTDPLTGARVVHYEPIPERVSKLVRLSLNWARLRRITPSRKKVAIIFHNYPPRNDQIGTAFGLDSAASVWNIMAAMRDAGYTLDHMPEDGQALMRELLAKVTNDRRWQSAEEMAEKAVAEVTRRRYGGWLRELPKDVQERMRKDWEEPPGTVFNHGGSLLIPGIVNGNLFIGMQPPRGFGDNPAAIYHSPDLSIPYHYHAYYQWIRNVFKADVVMHIGKHGSLEWLPGKSAGLSASCFPDVAISDLPNIYPYIINNPGEGTQAKRRSYCCIIDHLVPVMHNADAYEEMAELEVLQNDYFQARSEDPNKLPTLREMIWEKTCQAKLDHDLDVGKKEAFDDFDAFLEILHGYINELADTQIRDGLHVFGEPPEGGRLDEFLVALTRLNNGSVPSLRQSLAAIHGFDYEALLENRGKRRPDGRTNGQLIEELNGLCLRLVTRLHGEGFTRESIDGVMREVLGRENGAVKKVLDYVCASIVPSLAATTDELAYALAAAGGSFVPPGPSGAPTRGMADILPTGRNFYSVDPQAIPSPAAWKVGMALCDALLERYQEDEGRYPESIGMIIWGTGTMRTKGDDIAQILYMMGARPVWEPGSGRVDGVEIIPLEELGRPRIDVTLRISGLFRDAFPNLVFLLDEAVSRVAALEEPPEMNYVAKHVNDEVRERTAQGLDPVQAREEAGYRIFGCKPGTYGAGVSDAVEAKNWKDEKDLGEVYVLWGGYAYGRKNYGVTVPEQFKRRLSQIDATVKNEDTREYDMLDGDDFYSYHGGMIAAVKAFKGVLPRSYSGDNSDPERVTIRSTVEETKHVFRARLLNPKWISSMQRHGYKGAADLSRAVDIAFGWDATAEVLEDWMYEELAEKYALDKAMQEWLKDVNPAALQNMAERFLEAIERGMWRASEEMKSELRDVYLEIEGVLEEGAAK